MCWNQLEFILLVVAVGEVNNIGLTSQLLLKLVTRLLLTSDFGPAFHSVLYTGQKNEDRPKEDLAALQTPSCLSREESTSQSSCRNLGSLHNVTAGVTAARSYFAHLGPKLCIPCLNAFLLNFALVSPKRLLFQMPKSVFSPVFRDIQRISRLSGQTTDLPTNHPMGKRHLPEELQPCNSETGICSGRTSPSPTAAPRAKCCACTLSARGTGCPLFVWCCTVMPIAAIKVVAKLT